MLSIRCPHCGTTFSFDPTRATVSNGPPGTSSVPSSGLTYRPECPRCDRRVPLRVPPPAVAAGNGA